MLGCCWVCDIDRCDWRSRQRLLIRLCSWRVRATWQTISRVLAVWRQLQTVCERKMKVCMIRLCFSKYVMGCRNGAGVDGVAIREAKERQQRVWRAAVMLSSEVGDEQG